MKKTHDTLFKGDRSEAMVLAACAAKRLTVSVPIEAHCKYDCVVDRKGKLYRCQIKTGRLSPDKNILLFSPCSRSNRRERTSYQGEIEIFAVYSHELRRVYMIPISKVHAGASMSLRLNAGTKSNQKSGVHFAKDFLFYDFVKG